jgi:hypothetical protein
MNATPDQRYELMSTWIGGICLRQLGTSSGGLPDSLSKDRTSGRLKAARVAASGGVFITTSVIISAELGEYEFSGPPADTALATNCLDEV